MTHETVRIRAQAILTRRRGITASLTLVVMLLAAPLAGCSKPSLISDEQARFLNSPEERHAIGFSEQAATLFIEVPRRARGLSFGQRDDVAEFVSQYKSAGVGKFTISLPHSRTAAGAVNGSMRGVTHQLSRAGVDPSKVVVRRQRADTGHQMAITLSFARVKAVPPVCGDWSEDLAINRERVHFKDYGCTTQRNLAIMTVNARDLMQPQPETPRPGERLGEIWSGYTKQGPAGGGGDAGGKPPAGDAKGAGSTPSAK